MRRLVVLPLLLACAAPAAARADTLVAAAPGARHLAAGHGVIAWARPNEAGRWRLVVRAEGTAVRTPPIRGFGAAPDPAIGRLRGRVVVAYSRCAGASAVRGCDVYALDVRSGRETRVRALATRAYSETAADLDGTGRWSFVRRDGARNGVHVLEGRRVRRLSARVARETAIAPAHVVFVDPTPYADRGCCTVVRAVQRDRPSRLLSFGSPVGAAPASLSVAGDRAFWLDTPARASSTIALDPAGRGHRDVTAPAAYDLPATTRALAATGRVADLYLDAEGVKQVERPLFAPLEVWQAALV